MTDDFNLKHELEKLHQYLYGAHHATDDAEASEVFHTACHKVDDIINKITKQMLKDMCK